MRYNRNVQLIQLISGLVVEILMFVVFCTTVEDTEDTEAVSSG